MYIQSTCVLLLYDGRYDSVRSGREMDGERVPVNFRERVCEQFVSVNFQIASRSGRNSEDACLCWIVGSFVFMENF